VVAVGGDLKYIYKFDTSENVIYSESCLTDFILTHIFIVILFTDIPERSNGFNSKDA